MLSRAARITFGLAHVVTAAIVALGVFAGLPSRWWPVDASAAAVVASQAAAAVGLLVAAPWGHRAARGACALALGLGLFLVTVASVTAGWLSGVYGPVGRGGAITLALVAALALPYLVVLPLVELVWLRPRSAPVEGSRPAIS